MSELFASLQRALPQHQLSRWAGHFGRSRTPWIKRTFIHQFANAYNVNLGEAEIDNLDDFACFNDFFTRALKPGARPLADGIVCPSDGAVSQAGSIENGALLQAKGHTYSLRSLAGELASGFDGGDFCTIYLAPMDYHRIHLPLAGNLTHTLAIPGALYSVNGATENAIEGLFARNERLVCRFETELGPMLVVLVGAMIVASIETVWEGPASPYASPTLTHHDEYLMHGEEIGRFLLGSTVICCFAPGAVDLNQDLQPGHVVRMGEQMGLPTNS